MTEIKNPCPIPPTTYSYARENPFERRTIGEGFVIKELKSGACFEGTLSEWQHFQKHNMEMLATLDLLNNII